MEMRASPQRLADDIEALASIREPDEPGYTRRAFTQYELEGRALVVDLMRQAGLSVSADAVGNVVGRLRGATDAGAVVTGSHIDTVAGAGRFDGVIGVLGAIEAVRVLQERETVLEREVRVVAFFGEETNSYGLSCVGSRALVGALSPAHLELESPGGETLGEALRRNGGEFDAAVRSEWSAQEVRAFVELHVEQGPVLEADGIDIGVVERIVGIRRCSVVFHGQRDHAGTTPMEHRRDACTAMAESIIRIEQFAIDAGALATPGRVASLPGQTNVVPYRAELTLELRSADQLWLDQSMQKVEHLVSEVCARRQVDAVVEELPHDTVIELDEDVQDAIETAATDLGLSAMRLVSGATHDAAFMARRWPSGMVFVPSRNGRSHCPEEFTDSDQIARGVDVLTGVLIALGGST